MIPTLSVFIPCYNEEHILERNVKKAQQAVEQLGMAYELVIVDDSSTDNTSRKGKELAQLPNVSYVRFDNGPSRRENLGVAMRKAKGKFVMFMDADLATDLRHFPSLIAGLQTHDIVIGSRYMLGSKVVRNPMRRTYSFFYNMIIRAAFGSRIDDHQCGFKAFQKSVLISLLDSMGKDKTHRRGWFWDAEILLRAQRKGHTIMRVPVIWNRGAKSSFSLRREIKVLPYMISLKWRLLTEKS